MVPPCPPYDSPVNSLGSWLVPSRFPKVPILDSTINFHISDQMNFQEFNNNILSVHSAPPIVQQQISNPFFLKWVSGTTVSKCYGCNGSIPNPPINMLDNLIVARKDIRHYRDRNTGQ